MVARHTLFGATAQILMELNCPNCMTHFAIPDGAIGSSGRRLKCVRCGHTWRQLPPGYEPSSAAADTGEETFRAPEYGSDLPDPFASARSEEEANAAFDQEVFSQAAFDAEYPDTSLPSGQDQDQVAGFDPETMPMEAEAAPAWNASTSAYQETGAESSSEMPDLDFGDTDFSAMDRQAKSEAPSFSAQRDDDDIPNLDDLLSGSAGDMPRMYNRSASDDDDEDEEKGVSGVVVGLLTALVVLAGLSAAAWFGRVTLVEAVPALEPVYAALGIEVDTLGAGLQFKDVTSERLAQNGVDTLVVRGFIANTTNKPHDLPYLRLVLFDATDAVAQQVYAEPPQQTLAPEATTGFRIHLVTPSPAARRFEVDWTKPPPAEGSEPKH